MNKFSNLQWEQERSQTAVRDSDGTGSEVTLDGIWVPIYAPKVTGDYIGNF